MKVDITDIIGVKGASLDFEVSAQRLPLVFPFSVSGFVEPVTLEGKITNTGEFYLVQGILRTKLAVECDRCLQPFEYPVVFQIEADFHKDYAETTEPVDDEETVYGFEGSSIDLSKMVEDELLVGLPIKILCQEDCKGLCSTCGQDLNLGQCDCSDDSIDPRMEALRSLLDKKD